jgi:hypothetical protein
MSDSRSSEISPDAHPRKIDSGQHFSKMLFSGVSWSGSSFLAVAFRHGINDFSVPRWKAFVGIQKDFEYAIGESIYKNLPGIVGNTFGFTPSA